MGETPASLRPGFPFTWVNKLDPLRHRLVPLTAGSVMKWAERATGLEDWGDDGIHDRLDETLASLAEVDLTTTGRFGVRYVLTGTSPTSCGWSIPSSAIPRSPRYRSRSRS